MGFVDKLKKGIYLFDTYATSFQVKFQYSSVFQTNVGGIVSIIILLLGLMALIFLYVFLEKKEEQRIVTFNFHNPAPPKFDIFSDYNQIQYSYDETPKGFFLIAFYFYHTEEGSLTLEKFEKNITLNLEDIIAGKPDIKIPLTLVECESKYPGISKFLNNELLKSAYCINNDFITVEGEYISKIYHYILFRLIFKEEIPDLDVDKLKIYVLNTDYSILPNVKKGSPIQYTIKPLEININSKVQYEANIFISLNTFNSNGNIYAPWQKKKNQKCLRVENIVNVFKSVTKEKDEKRAVSLYFRSNINYKQYIRSYKSFFDLLCQIGGLWKVFFFIGSIIAIPVNLSMMNISISNKLFNMINPNNEDDVRMSYDQFCAKEEEYGKVPEIFMSLNPVLKRISIEYYKYERNKGLDFTLKEAFEKIFCCCCGISSLKEKDKIFKSSRKEIEKRLDTITVAKFAQELKAMKKIFLGDHSLFIDYDEKSNVDYTMLPKIRQESNEQFVFSTANPISLVFHKQNLLVSSFNILRNQGDLNRLDLLMIKLLKIDPELVMKFFITYYDRFELIYPEKFHKKIKKPLLIQDEDTNNKDMNEPTTERKTKDKDKKNK